MNKFRGVNENYISSVVSTLPAICSTEKFHQFIKTARQVYRYLKAISSMSQYCHQNISIIKQPQAKSNPDKNQTTINVFSLYILFIISFPFELR